MKACRQRAKHSVVHQDVVQCSITSEVITCHRTRRAGVLAPEVLLQRALDILIHKCQALLEDL